MGRELQLTFTSIFYFLPVLLQKKKKKKKHQLLKHNVKGHTLVYFAAIFVAFIQGHLYYGGLSPRFILL